MSPIVLFLCALCQVSSLSSSKSLIPFDENEADFDLIDTKTGHPVLNRYSLRIRDALRYVAHAKALMILQWQQKSEADRTVGPGLKLAVSVHFWKCSVWEFGSPVNVPHETFMVSEDNRTIHLLDFDCILNELYEWCADVPGRRLNANYTMDREFGHSIEMVFGCDPAIVRNSILNFSTLSWILGVAVPLVLLTLILVTCERWRKQKKITITSEKQLEETLARQNSEFLTVPVRVRPRTLDSGRRAMMGRMVDMDGLLVRTYHFHLQLNQKSRSNFKHQFNIPRIVVNGPEE